MPPPAERVEWRRRQPVIYPGPELPLGRIAPIRRTNSAAISADVDPAIAGKAAAEWISSNKARQKAREAAWQAWSEHAQKKTTRDRSAAAATRW
jgi:glycerol-3-phosphate O-acyltransferase